MSTADTRLRLEAAALAALREDGLTGISARTVARRAGVNQALIFYHYESLTRLVRTAALASVEAAVARYRAGFEASTSFGQLLAAGRRLDAAERGAGSVAIMAHLLAGGHVDPEIGACARDCLALWLGALEPVVARLLRAGPLAGLADPRALARAVVAGFVGLELYGSVDPDGAGVAVTGLSELGALLEALDSLGPVAQRALRARLRRRQRPARAAP